jgi:uncharacterized Zn-finger protein
MKTRSHICPQEGCFKSFRTEDSLADHLKVHQNDRKRDPKDFTCDTCGRVLSTKQSLKEHTYTHKEKKTFRCSEVGCGKMFRQNSQLCNHRKLHKIEKIKRIAEARESGNIPIVNRKFKENQKSCGYFQDVVLPVISGPVFGVSLPLFNSMFK